MTSPLIITRDETLLDETQGSFKPVAPEALAVGDANHSEVNDSRGALAVAFGEDVGEIDR